MGVNLEFMSVNFGRGIFFIKQGPAKLINSTRIIGSISSWRHYNQDVSFKPKQQTFPNCHTVLARQASIFRSLRKAWSNVLSGFNKK